ncbi:Nucleolysin TIAR [Mortierella alpina]|nr:Nucleolysin TIAR [Mortierella alpina]
MWGNPEDYLNDDQVDDSYEGLLRLSERIGQAKAKGVSEQTLRDMDKHIASWSRVRAIKAALPSSTASTSTSTSTSTSSTSSADDGVDENCTICLQTYKLPDLLRTLPCRHGFHVDCIDTWLQTSAQCPICRQEVTAAAVASMECI